MKFKRGHQLRNSPTTANRHNLKSPTSLSSKIINIDSGQIGALFTMTVKHVFFIPLKFTVRVNTCIYLFTKSRIRSKYFLYRTEQVYSTEFVKMCF